MYACERESDCVCMCILWLRCVMCVCVCMCDSMSVCMRELVSVCQSAVSAFHLWVSWQHAGGLCVCELFCISARCCCAHFILGMLKAIKQDRNLLMHNIPPSVHMHINTYTQTAHTQAHTLSFIHTRTHTHTSHTQTQPHDNYMHTKSL